MTGTLRGVSNKHCLLSFFSFSHNPMGIFSDVQEQLTPQSVVQSG